MENPHSSVICASSLHAGRNLRDGLGGMILNMRLHINRRPRSHRGQDNSVPKYVAVRHERHFSIWQGICRSGVVSPHTQTHRTCCRFNTSLLPPAFLYHLFTLFLLLPLFIAVLLFLLDYLVLFLFSSSEYAPRSPTGYFLHECNPRYYTYELDKYYLPKSAQSERTYISGIFNLHMRYKPFLEIV